MAVIQYACGHEMAGPAGCLQYFVGTTGRVARYDTTLIEKY
jgi:hypothetical protein